MDAHHKRQFKDELYETFSRVGKALANGHRLELLDLLAQAERTVEDLAAETGMSVANTSQHLQVLRGACLVAVRREGQYAHYRLADDAVFGLWRSLRQVAEARLPDIDRVVRTYLGDRDSLDAVPADELLARLREGEAVLLDVRPQREYASGHLPGARSIPVDELESRLEELPSDVEIVAYCRGPYCVYSDEAVRLLREHGFEARRFELGVADWRSLGLPAEVEEAA